jgi:hypothetical protein
MTLAQQMVISTVLKTTGFNARIAISKFDDIEN